jgi:hypothetical protein
MNIPPESILINTAEIAKACEIAEISCIPSSDSFILVTQLASLLVLGRYNHARHLWRRYNSEVVTDTEMEDSTSASTSTATTTKTGGDLDMHQFQLLWNAAQPLLKSFYGHVSLLESGSDIFTSLQSCVDANLHPLSMYALELKGVIRDQMAALIETVYDSIQVQKCQALLGKSSEGGEDFDQYLVQRGWGKSSDTVDIWIPASPLVADYSTGKDQISKNSGQKSKIEFLSNVVGFMEKQRVHS